MLPSANQIEADGPLEAREKSCGYEVLLPISKVVCDRVTLLGNAGLRSFFDWRDISPPPTAWEPSPFMP